MDEHRKIFTPPGGPPHVAVPSPDIFNAMGEDGFYRMLADFYLMLSRSEIRDMFPSSAAALLDASKRSAAFFIQICGGPPVYNQTFGPPRLRARHLPFEIGEREKSVWLDCFRSVLADAPQKYGFPKVHLPGFIHWLTAFAGWMVNKKTEIDEVM